MCGFGEERFASGADHSFQELQVEASVAPEKPLTPSQESKHSDTCHPVHGDKNQEEEAGNSPPHRGAAHMEGEQSQTRKMRLLSPGESECRVLPSLPSAQPQSVTGMSVKEQTGHLSLEPLAPSLMEGTIMIIKVQN